MPHKILDTWIWEVFIRMSILNSIINVYQTLEHNFRRFYDNVTKFSDDIVKFQAGTFNSDPKDVITDKIVSIFLIIQLDCII